MHPLLIKIGSVPIHTYGFLIAIGFLVAVAVIKRLSNRSGLNEDRILDLTFWSLAVGFLGARFLFVLTQWSSFARDPVSIFRVWEGGLVFFGGPLAVVPFVWWYVRKHKLPIWKTMDVMAPGLVIAHAFGRLGCVAAGCCYGKPTEGWFGIKLHSELVDPAMRNIPLHPVQLYESLALVILFFGLLRIFRKRAFDGQIVLTYFMTYPVIRSVVEVFRGDLIRGFVIEGVLSTSQFISLLLFLVTSAILLIRLKQVQGNRSLIREGSRA